MDQISHLKTVVVTPHDKDGILYVPDSPHKKAIDPPISYDKILGSTSFHRWEAMTIELHTLSIVKVVLNSLLFVSSWRQTPIKSSQTSILNKNKEDLFDDYARSAQ